MADADERCRRHYQESLARDGFDVVTVSNGIECVEALRECPPDVLILDLYLPWGGADGVLAIMAEDPELARIPVLVHTMCRDPQIWKAIGSLRVSDFHYKPVTPEHLSRRLGVLVNYRRILAAAENRDRDDAEVLR